ncbi:hypothetical protein E2C01_089640 [Portunus trituberculatus]|uniref:Uncharacterized protein n=1 Tax=Portunus trituberculatus TaxID=210409 RepID=A0A5B7JCK9_PORTR|nr:hypothetical protein [Portunus trituberculatus]
MRYCTALHSSENRRKTRSAGDVSSKGERILSPPPPPPHSCCLLLSLPSQTPSLNRARAKSGRSAKT